jgi:hypothetical protein
MTSFFRLIFGIAILLLLGCEKNADESKNFFAAKIVGFDENCSTCILSFPDDSIKIKNLIGESPNNYYQSVNLNTDSFLIGQRINVRLRKPEDSEILACITLYPSVNYTNVFITEYEYSQNLIFNDTIPLRYKECLYNHENKCCICLDSVLNDSRCPTGLVCFWEGNASVRFKFERYNEIPVFVDLNTNSKFRRDTIVKGIRLFLAGLTPYPEIYHETEWEDCKAEIIITKVNEYENNN